MSDKLKLSASLVSSFLVIVIALTACHPDKTESDQPKAGIRASQVDPSSLVVINRRAPFAVDMSPEEARNALREDYQIVPDRRFLLALSSVRSLVRGRNRPEKLELKFKEMRWHLSIRDVEIGTLSEFPGFQEMYNLLLNFTKSECRDQSFKLTAHTSPQVFEEAIKAFSPSQLTEAAARGDALWRKGDRSPETIYGVARTTCLLSCQSVDLLAVADGLTGRALLLAALADATGSGDMLRWRCMLAESMGYLSAAGDMARFLRKDDVFASFMKGDGAHLKALAIVPRSHEAAYLYLRYVCQKRDRKAWKEWIETIYPINKSLNLPALRAVSEMAANDWMMQLGFALARSSTAEVEAAPEAKSYTLKVSDFEWADPYRRYEESAGWMLNNLLAEFESALEKRKGVLYASTPGGTALFGEENAECFYRSYFYSAVYTLSRCYFSLPSARTFCTTFADSLKVSGPAPALQLERWLKDRIAVSEREKTFKNLESDFTSFTFLGAPAHLALFEDMGASFQSNRMQAVIPLAHLLFDRVDSRPSLRTSLSRIAEYSLMDVALSHRLTQALVEEMPSRSLSEQVSRAVGLNDVREAERLLLNSDLSASERAGLLSTLKLLKAIDKERLISEYQKVVSLSRGQWWAMDLLAESLMERGRYRAVTEALSTWLKERKGTPSLDEIPALLLISDALRKEGKLDQAWAVLNQPHIKKAGRLELLLARSRLCLYRKQTMSALDWAGNALMLYPEDVNALSTKVEILWRLNRYSEAADLVSSKKEQLTRRNWSFVLGRAFVSAIGHDWPRATMALGALKDAGVDNPDNLGQIAHAYYIAGLPDIAFNALAKVRVPESAWADYYSCAYRYLKAWKGRDVALAWIEREVPAGKRASMAPYAFISGQYELLWEARSDDGELKLLEAASYLMEEKPDPAHLKILKTSKGKASRPLDEKLSSYILGDSTAVLSEKMGRKDLARALFFIGWKDLSTGCDFIESLSWYRAALEFGSPESEEYGYSATWLSDIVQTLADKPRDWKVAGLDHLRVEMPSDTGNWDARRRFRLVVRNTTKSH